MKLRTKLVLAGIMIILLPMFFSTGMMWYLIQQQNAEDAREDALNSFKMIHDDLQQQGRELVEEMVYFAQDSVLLKNITNLNQRRQVNMSPLLQELHQKESAVTLGKFARINRYNLLLLFDYEHSLLSLTQLENETLTLGLLMDDTAGAETVKSLTVTDELREIGDLDADGWTMLQLNELLPASLPQRLSRASHSLEVFGEYLTLKTTVPIYDSAQSESSEPIGALVGFRYVNQAWIEKLAEHTQVHLDIFLERQRYAGTLPKFSELDSDTLRELDDGLTGEQVTPHAHTERDVRNTSYYQTYFPLVRDDDGTLRCTLVLSLSQASTTQKTKEAVILQSWVSLISVLCIIPFILLLAKQLTDPIRKISAVSESIATGCINQLIEPMRSKDEIGRLSRSFHAMVLYLREMARIAENISRGEITQELSPKNEQDVLGTAFHRMTSYLRHIAQVAEKIQQGDLTHNITPYSERDVLGTTFNAMTQRLHELVTHLRVQSRDLAEVSQLVASMSEDSSQANALQSESVETTTLALHEMALNISNISHNIEIQTQSVEQVQTATQHIVASSEDIAGRGGHLSSFATEIAASMLKMDNSVQTINAQVQTSVEASKKVLRVVEQGTSQMTFLMQEIMAVQQHMETTSSSILRLQQESQYIGEILSVIEDVVDQTNLLSLNASIISAQAGSDGRAFGIVAEEIKALATRTSESTKEIAKFINTIATELTEAVNAMMLSANYVEEGLKHTQQTEQVFDAISSGAEQSSKLIEHTALSLEEHSRASGEIKNAGKEAVMMIEAITSLTQEQHGQSESIHAETEYLSGISMEIQQATEEQSSAAHQSVEKMSLMTGVVQQSAERAERLAKLSVTLSSQAEDLLQQVEQFTVRE